MLLHESYMRIHRCLHVIKKISRKDQSYLAFSLSDCCKATISLPWPIVSLLWLFGALISLLLLTMLTVLIQWWWTCRGHRSYCLISSVFWEEGYTYWYLWIRSGVHRNRCRNRNVTQTMENHEAPRNWWAVAKDSESSRDRGPTKYILVSIYFVGLIISLRFFCVVLTFEFRKSDQTKGVTFYNLAIPCMCRARLLNMVLISTTL